jgi:FKBP-type peptidyl-prolyl cis-trans isomerase
MKKKMKLAGLLGAMAMGLLAACEDSSSGQTTFERDIEIIEQYLADQGVSDYNRTSSGIFYHTLQPGTGQVIPTDSIVAVGYEGWLPYGPIFDSSFLRDDTLRLQQGTGSIVGSYAQIDCDTVSTEPLELASCTDCPTLGGGVITGWVEALQLLSVGERTRFYIPSALGYGSRANGAIPGNSVLIFDIEAYGYEGIPDSCATGN